MKNRDLVQLLESAGYRLARHGDDHDIYKREGSRSVQVPRHKEINEYTAEAILKVAGLKKSNSRKLPENDTGRKNHDGEGDESSGD